MLWCYYWGHRKRNQTKQSHIVKNFVTVVSRKRNLCVAHQRIKKKLLYVEDSQKCSTSQLFIFYFIGYCLMCLHHETISGMIDATHSVSLCANFDHLLKDSTINFFFKWIISLKSYKLNGRGYAERTSNKFGPTFFVLYYWNGTDLVPCTSLVSELRSSESMFLENES